MKGGHRVVLEPWLSSLDPIANTGSTTAATATATPTTTPTTTTTTTTTTTSTTTDYSTLNGVQGEYIILDPVLRQVSQLDLCGCCNPEGEWRRMKEDEDLRR